MLRADEGYFKCYTRYTSAGPTTGGMAGVFDVSMITAAGTEGVIVEWSIYGEPAPFRPGDYAMILGGPWPGGIVVGDAPTIGQASIAIEGPFPRIGQQAQAAFIKGNVVVVILIQGTGEDVAAENAIKLAQVSADRIPDISPMPEPTLFPDKLDQTAGGSIFKSIEIGKMEGDQFVPAATFSSKEDKIYVKTEAAVEGQTSQFSLGIYDLGRKWYPYGLDIGIVGGRLYEFGTIYSAGQYEARIAVGDTLIAVMPFEVK